MEGARGEPGSRASFAAGLTAGRLESVRLVLAPVGPEHAGELVVVLGDASLHSFIGGEPEDHERLRERLEKQAHGSPVAGERWLNWIIRERTTGQAIGTMQATVTMHPPAPTPPTAVAELAWVVGIPHHRRGYAREAAQLVAAWLRTRGVDCLRAHIHPRHHASMAVARAIGLAPTNVAVDEEIRWEAEARTGGVSAARHPP